MVEKVVTHFSHGDTFGKDRYGRIAGFNGINQTGLTTSAVLAQVPDVASGGVLAAHTTQTMTHSIRIESEDGSKYYVMCTNVVTNRTGGA